LPKKNRISKELFRELFPKGRGAHSRVVLLKIVPINEKDTRFAFVVPSKTAKKAVDRNKLKRRARYITAKLLPFIKTGVAVIVFFKKGAEKLNFKELEKEIGDIYRKAGILQ